MDKTKKTRLKDKQVPKTKKIVGFTCSAFDLCHAGHILMLQDCKNVCDYLVVGLQDDPSNLQDAGYRDKTKNRPIMSLEERKIILEGIRYVDEIFTYSDEADLYEKLKKLRYNIRILGSDWKGKKYTGYDLPHKAYFHDRGHGFSTSELRERVWRAEEKKMAILKEFAPPTKKAA